MKVSDIPVDSVYEAYDRSTLHLHQQSKHKGIRYSCDRCDHQTTRPRYLQKHKESKHDGIPVSSVNVRQQGRRKSRKAKTDITLIVEFKVEGLN